MFDDRIGNLQKMLARMRPEGRQRYAADHADDPIAVSMALFVNNIAKEIKEGKRGEPEVQAPVVQQAIQAMNQPRMPQGMPPQGMPPQGMPQQGQPQAQQGPQQAMPQAMPQPAMPQQAPQQAPQQQGQTQRAADGGYMDSRLPEEMGIGALPERSLSNMADGGIVGFAIGGTPKGKKQASFDNALDVEGIRDPRERAFLKALHGQESDSGQNITTSNRGAVGGMQILPGTFKQVADKNMDINDPFDNMRAGIRYGMKGYNAAGGDPVLAGAYYYGGPGGMRALEQGTARSDPKNPKAPNTREYGQSIAKRMERNLPTEIQMAKAQAASKPKTVAQVLTEALPIGTAQGQTPAATAAAPVTAANADAARDALVAQIPGDNNRYVAPQKTSKDKSDKSFSQFTGNEQVVGAGEAALGLGTGLVDYLGSAAKGLFTGVTGGDTQKASNESMGSTTYDPRTEAGRVALENSQKFLTDTLKLPPYMARIGAGTPYPAARFVKPKESVAPTSVPAAAPTSVVRTVPTPAQVAAGNPSVTTTKPPVAQPPVAQPRPEGIARLNRAKENNAAIRLAAEQEAAAKAGAPPPPNLVINPRVVPAKPKTVEVAGLPAIIEQTAAKEAAVKEAAVKEAAATAAKETIVKEAEVQAAPNVIPEAAGRPIEFPKASPRITYPNVVTSLAKNAGAAATAIDGADNTNEREPYSTGNYKGRSGIADIDIGPAQERPSFDRTSGDDTTQFPSITPKIAETAVSLAQDQIPKKEQGGFGYEDLLMFGLNLMAGQSPNALTNVGTAGIAALTARQARAKAEADKRKSEAEALRDTAYGEYYKDKIAQGPEERRLAAEEKKLLAEDRRTKIENEKLDRADRLVRQREADEVTKQQRVDAALQKNPSYLDLMRQKTIFGFNQNKNEKQIQDYNNLLQQIDNFEYKFYKSRGIDNDAGFNMSPK